MSWTGGGGYKDIFPNSHRSYPSSISHVLKTVSLIFILRSHSLQELTAAQKKKLKKKAKEKAKKADGGDKEAGGKKGPAKKESAAVRKLREDLERQKAEQEAAKKAEEERLRQVATPCI